MISPDLRSLYQEVILDHCKAPRNHREQADCKNTADGYNPLCGDKVTMFARVTDGVLEDLSFVGSGCAISTASASMLTERLKGKTLDEAREVFEKFQSMITGSPGDPIDDEELGKLTVLSGVCEFPVRVKCATLCWHTFMAALESKGEDNVSTE